MKIPRKIRKAIKDIPNLTYYEVIGEMILASTEFFNIRVLGERGIISQIGVFDDGTRIWRVQFSWKKTFDRWANSANFETQIWYDPQKNQRYLDKSRKPQYTIPNMKKELEWCKSVAESGLFDFGTYYQTIRTPWFIHEI